jgi:two-component system response regulator HydG
MEDKKILLIVDDDIAHRTMLRILLNWQYEIFEADNGLSAIEEARRRNFDLILMDIRMPGISGMDALEQITSLKPDVPVLIMTAYISDEIANQAKAKGAFGCLGKPFDFEDLKLTMERAMLSWCPRQGTVQ